MRNSYSLPARDSETHAQGETQIVYPLEHKVRYSYSLPARDSETHAQGEIHK